MNALPTHLMPTAMPAAPTPAPGASAPPHDGSKPGFARCLDQAAAREPARAAGDKPATGDAPADAASPEAHEREADGTPNTASAVARRPPGAPTARKPEATAKGVAPVVVPDVAATKATTATIDAVVDTTATATPPQDDAPALADLLPGWTPPTTANTAATVPTPSAPTAAGTPAARAGDAAPPAALSTALSAQATTPTEAKPDIPTLRTDESAAAAAFALPTPAVPPASAASAVKDTPPPAQAHVAAPVDSPAFAPALATQVRWLVRDGLQHAQLSLNPAEMGPVTVQIVLDGREARIDFRADLALTRNAIESSLPVLAAALDESGLRLTGGGVHDGQTSRHPQGAMAQGGANSGAPGRGTVALDDETPARTARATAGPARGLVDLVA